MFDILKVITDRLDDTGYSIFFNEKNDETDYPFIIFNLRNSSEGTNIYREDYSLEVDVWTKNIIQCLEMIDEIKSLLNRYKYLNDKIQASFYVTNRFDNLPDEDDQIKRSQLRIQVKTYTLKNESEEL
jgi:hypothetical protein